MTPRLTPERRADLLKQAERHKLQGAIGVMLPVHVDHVIDLLTDLTDAEAEIARLRALVPAGTIEEGR